MGAFPAGIDFLTSSPQKSGLPGCGKRKKANTRFLSAAGRVMV